MKTLWFAALMVSTMMISPLAHAGGPKRGAVAPRTITKRAVLPKHGEARKLTLRPPVKVRPKSFRLTKAQRAALDAPLPEPTAQRPSFTPDQRDFYIFNNF